MQKLTKEQAVIISAYTGYTLCNFGDIQEEICKRLGGGVFTHMLGDKKFVDDFVRPAFKEDFLKLCAE